MALLIVLVIILAGTVGYLALVNKSQQPFPIINLTPTPTPTPEPSLTPKPSPKPTPTPVPSGEKIIRKVGEKESSFLIQKINSNSVEGLWFQAYPIEQPNDPGAPKTLYIGDDIGYACRGVSIKLISIDFPGQTITFNKVIGQPPDVGCPVCLAGDTLIDTPLGLILVKDLQVGMSVWTTDRVGHRVPAVVTKTSKVSVPPTHRMVDLVLNDGHELFVSAGHPT